MLFREAMNLVLGGIEQNIGILQQHDQIIDLLNETSEYELPFEPRVAIKAGNVVATAAFNDVSLTQAKCSNDECVKNLVWILTHTIRYIGKSTDQDREDFERSTGALQIILFIIAYSTIKAEGKVEVGALRMMIDALMDDKGTSLRDQLKKMRTEDFGTTRLHIPRNRF